MQKFIIHGGKKLSGAIAVKGYKNAATPIIAATLLTNKECIIKNVPRIGDVFRMIEIMESMGVEISWLETDALRIKAERVNPEKMDFKAVSRMRSSILLLGPLLARCGKFKMPQPGGCVIGARPIGSHFTALEKLGAKITKENGFYCFEAKKLEGKEIVLPEFSVTATENLMMAASLAPGITVIKIAALEPQVQDLQKFLKKMGAKIKFGNFNTVIIKGVKKLHGATYTVIPDLIEAGTFAIAAVATKSELIIKNVIRDHLDLVFDKLAEMGAKFEFDGDNVKIDPVSMLVSAKIEARIFPGLPSDLQAPFGVLATQAQGTSLIHDTLYEGRLGYVNELNKMGANAIICDPHRALISGPTQLYGSEITSFDLRAGATMIIAALVAQGESVISNIEQIDRGYENIEERLKNIGADITRMEI
ncbi:MAG: UDP-N-acetylglucosamine 1-carboxyvinyltransferase [Patescibacteria group bacterium]|nr:UDP-N-acetylglucosamine 1-carboxyvinyltransferase [Patescibacteria group bacterium]